MVGWAGGGSGPDFFINTHVSCIIVLFGLSPYFRKKERESFERERERVFEVVIVCDYPHFVGIYPSHLPPHLLLRHMRPYYNTRVSMMSNRQNRSIGGRISIPCGEKFATRVR
jgi:hypothetical protein